MCIGGEKYGCSLFILGAVAACRQPLTTRRRLRAGGPQSRYLPRLRSFPETASLERVCAMPWQVLLPSSLT